MKNAASTRLGCPADQVTLIPWSPPDTPAKATGCGKEDSIVQFCVTASGSGGSASSCTLLFFSEAIKQAAFTTGCDESEITATWMRPNLGVEACGQRMTFVATLSGWVLNTASGG